MKRTSLASRIAAPLASVAPCAAAAGPRFCLLLIAISAGTPALAFDYFEHRYIGEKAYENARNRHPDLSKALDTAGEALGFGRVPKDPRDVAGRVLQELPMQFGDLSALAGDLTENPEELREVVYDIKKWVGGTDAPPPLQLLHVITTRRIYRAESLVTDSRRQWFSACKWMYRRRFPQPGSGAAWENWANCFAQLGDQEFTLPRRSAFSSEGYQASHVELAEHEMIPKYISLAAENKEHFARYSWKEYSDNHARALKLARCYREKQECVGADGETKRGDALLVEMLVYEAYAQHFLHDSYASGHIGVAYSKCPIEKITLLCTPTKRRMQQTHDVLNEIGLDVAMPDAADVLKLSPKVAENLATGWTAFGDDYLFVPEADFHRSVVVLVATSSMTEVFDEATRPVPPPYLAGCARPQYSRFRRSESSRLSRSNCAARTWRPRTTRSAISSNSSFSR